jgi:hypothetical protein
VQGLLSCLLVRSPGECGGDEDDAALPVIDALADVVEYVLSSTQGSSGARAGERDPGTPP